MVRSTELQYLPAMPKEMRERVADTFDAFSEWGSEIEAINQRSLNKVLDKTSSLARSLGWPDYAIKATREYVESVSKLQTQAIEQIVEGWKQQLKSPVAPLGMPSIFGGQSPGAAPNFGAMPEFNPMAPWAFWMQAAQAWQRTWMPEATQRDRSH